jgi:hypothetical protein
MTEEELREMKQDEWYPCFVSLWMWKAETDKGPRIIWFRVANETLNDIENWLCESDVAYKI